ncbi:hypothetical protein SCUCBS95973_000285 [Sporothrix curviconia]|uniref:Carboxylesterase type B domain-containing protein n=1 Tax=Sporothrix curviconia TaxID=1260050 RepID=A0ABP0ANW6_9PEZI
MDSSDRMIEVKNGLGSFRARFQACTEKQTAPATAPSEHGVLKCLGISYGQIPRRWAAPRPALTPWKGTQDLTDFGPACPQVHEPLFAVPGLPVFGPPSETSISILARSEDEYRCLNLNVFAPVRLGDEERLEQPPIPLPVLVWVHGGAFRAGCGGTDLYDGSPLVARSVDFGHPVIVVTLNYRLGVLGFVHSQKLLEDAAKQEDVPEHCRSTANLALLDISMAFSWIKHNISCFGGDPSNVTGFGESAGSALLNYMALTPSLYPNIPRMLYSSSTIFSVQLLQGKESQQWMDAICAKNDIPPDSGDSVDRLRRLDIHTLVQSSHFACSSFRPILDGVTIPSDPRSAIFGDARWDPALKEVIFGHCENEAWLKLAYRQGVPPPLESNIAGRMPPVQDLRGRAQNLYNAAMDSRYSWYQSPIPSTLSPGGLAWMALDGHARYYVPGQLLGTSFAKGSEHAVAYRYIFKWTPMQWPENWPATHTADLLPMFLHKSLGAEDMLAARSFADQIVLFASGGSAKANCLQIYAETTGWLSNVFERDGRWTTTKKGEEEFGLSSEAVALWEDVFRVCLDWEQSGWEGMIR